MAWRGMDIGFVAGALLVAACGNGDGRAADTDTESDSDTENDCETHCYQDPPDVPTPEACTIDDDCADDERCIEDVCVLAPEGYCDERLDLDTLALGAITYAIVTDVDGDGATEVVGVDAESLVAVFYESATDARVVTSTPPSWIIWPTAADIDGDGNVDVVAGAPENGETIALAGDGAGGFVEATRIDAGASMLAAGDFDANGNADVAVAVDGATWILVGDGTFALTHEPMLDLPRADGGFAVGEIDGMPGDDLVFTSQDLTAAVGASASGWSAIVTDSSSNPQSFPRVADVNGDGRDEIFGLGPEVVLVWTGASDDPFASLEQLGAPAHKGLIVDVGEFIGDATTDVVVPSHHGVLVLDRALACWTEVPIEGGSSWVRTLDFDGDGDDDVVSEGIDGLTIVFGE